jgi:hypothetical protein
MCANSYTKFKGSAGKAAVDDAEFSSGISALLQQASLSSVEVV